MNRRPPGSVSYDNVGRIVLVTGGANGIGRAICESFADSNAEQVFCADVDVDAGKRLGKGISFLKTNVADEASCRDAVETIIDRYEAIDVLVNNAAIQPPQSYVRVDELEEEMLKRMCAVNFFGYTFMAKHAFAVMRRQKSGVVINISSGQGHRSARGVPVYGPIKAANILQAMQWGVEYGRDGIRVVSVSPGAVDTPLVRASLEQQGGESELANRHPLGRIGKPEEIAKAVLWLASSDASFVTATDLAVDGGLGGFGSFADPYRD